MFRVLITRDREHAAALIEKLALQGISGIACPVTEIEVLADNGKFPDLTQYRAFLFTSARAVKITAALFDKCREKISESVLLFAVGSVTARIVEEEFSRHADIVGSDGGEVLAGLILDRYGSLSPILWPAADQTATDLSCIFKEHGIKIDKWPIYRTRMVGTEGLKENLRQIGDFDAIFFAAPGATKSLGRLEWLRDKPAIAIGESTARELSARGWQQIVVAKSPEVEDCARAIVNCLTGSC